jgi:hypothetical protein
VFMCVSVVGGVCRACVSTSAASVAALSQTSRSRGGKMPQPTTRSSRNSTVSSTTAAHAHAPNSKMPSIHPPLTGWEKGHAFSLLFVSSHAWSLTLFLVAGTTVRV